MWPRWWRSIRYNRKIGSVPGIVYLYNLKLIYVRPKEEIVGIWLWVGSSPHAVVGNMLNCDIVVSKFELQSCYYVYFKIFLGKAWTPLSPLLLWVKKYHCCSSTRMAFALNNPWGLICHKSKKPNMFAWILSWSSR